MACKTNDLGHETGINSKKRNYRSSQNQYFFKKINAER
jgi:hypothetical protein